MKIFQRKLFWYLLVFSLISACFRSVSFLSPLQFHPSLCIQSDLNICSLTISNKGISLIGRIESFITFLCLLDMNDSVDHKRMRLIYVSHVNTCRKENDTNKNFIIRAT